jgi:hypothetical protein
MNLRRLVITKESTIVLLVLVMSLILINSGIGYIRADGINPSVYSTNDKPYGVTYGEWTANFWKWVIAIPQNVNPNNDATGKNCAINQKDTNVWYLAPTFGGAAERTCTIPRERSILFPLLAGECNYLENPELTTESQLHSCAMQANDVGSRSMEVIVDGVKLKNLENYRAQSAFDISFPPNNIFSVKPGINTKVSSDGFWVFLKPLSTGKHELEFSASQINPSEVSNYNTHVKYHLIVAP